MDMMKRGKLTCWLLLWLSYLTFGCKQIPQQQAGTKEKAVTLKIPNHPLRNEQDLDILLQEIGDARVVLLGEASHGTSEYYTWRAAIFRRLIQEKGFDYISIKGEWADSYRVKEYINGWLKDSAATVPLLEQYDRWPTWMWGKYEVASLVTWLNEHNQSKPEASKVGIFGLDVYCLWESMTKLMPYVQDDPSLVKAAKKVHECFQPYSADPLQYAQAVANADANCRAETNRLWKEIQKRSEAEVAAQCKAQSVAEQNALVALKGERYYRSAVSSSSESWNIRDRHMALTLKRLLDFQGPDSKRLYGSTTRT
jgi:erythromycin esterase-like protein